MRGPRFEIYEGACPLRALKTYSKLDRKPVQRVQEVMWSNFLVDDNILAAAFEDGRVRTGGDHHKGNYSNLNVSS